MENFKQFISRVSFLSLSSFQFLMNKDDFLWQKTREIDRRGQGWYQKRKKSKNIALSNSLTTIKSRGLCLDLIFMRKPFG